MLEYIGITEALGKGEAKSLIKSEIIKRWQNEWDAEFNARRHISMIRHYHKIQNNVTGKGLLH